MANTSLKLGFLAVLFIATGLPHVMSDLPPCVTEHDCLAPCGSYSKCTGQRADGTPGCICSAKQVTQPSDLPPCVTEKDCARPCGGKGVCTGERKDGTPGCICRVNTNFTVPTPAAPAKTVVNSGDLSPCVTETDCAAPCGGKGLCTGQRKDGTPGCVCSANAKSTVPTPAPAQTPVNSGDLSPCVMESDCTAPCGGKGLCTGQRKDGTPGCVCQSGAAKKSSSTAAAAKKRGHKKHKKSKAGKKGKRSKGDLAPCVTEDDCVAPCGRRAPCSGQRKDGTPGCVCRASIKFNRRH